MEFFSLNSERKKAKKDKIAELQEKIEEMEGQLEDFQNDQNEDQENMEDKFADLEYKFADLEKILKVQSKKIQAYEQNQLYQKHFYFKASNGMIVSGEDGSCSMKADRKAAYAHEFFIMEQFGDSKVAFKSMGKYMSSENGYGKMCCDRRTPDAWEHFELIHHQGNGFSLKGNNGMYVSNRDGHLYCDAADIGEADTFQRFYDI